MKLTVLCDNNTYIDKYYLGEPALSFYIEDGDEKILFDTGYSHVFLDNAEKMGIDLGLVDAVVLSHGHNDHTRGLKYILPMKNTALVAHPDCFNKKYESDGTYIGADYTLEEIKNLADYIDGTQPRQLTENLWYLGQIERVTDFENKNPVGYELINGEKCPDFLIDDTALAYKGKDGIFVITGCSHSGICNIIEQAKRVCGDEKITGVIGGFHLFENNELNAHIISTNLVIVEFPIAHHIGEWLTERSQDIDCDTTSESVFLVSNTKSDSAPLDKT